MKKLILLILLNFTVFFSSDSLESLSLEESLINAAKKGIYAIAIFLYMFDDFYRM